MNVPDSWYSALSLDALRHCLQEYPLWNHVTTPTAAAQILTDGLRAGSDLGRSNHQPGLAARPGCAYLVNRDLHAWAAEWAGLADRPHAIVAVDLTGIHPGRIFPDEDEWTAVTGYMNDPRHHGLPRFEDTDHASSGDWSEAVRLGSQPGVSAAALSGGRIAVRAPISPSSLVRVDLAPGQYLRRWEERRTGARGT